MNEHISLFRMVLYFLLVSWFTPVTAWSIHERDPNGLPIPHVSGHKIPPDPKKSLIAPPKISAACHKDLIYETMGDMESVFEVMQRRRSTEILHVNLTSLFADLNERKKEIRVCSCEMLGERYNRNGICTEEGLRLQRKSVKEWKSDGTAPPPMPLICTGREFNELLISTKNAVQDSYDGFSEIDKELRDLDNLFTQLYNDCEGVRDSVQRDLGHTPRTSHQRGKGRRNPRR